MNDSNELNNAEHVSQNKKTKKSKKRIHSDETRKKILDYQKEAIWVLKGTGIGYVSANQKLLQEIVTAQVPNHDTLKSCTIKNYAGYLIDLEKTGRNVASHRKRVWKNDKGDVTKVPIDKLINEWGEYLSNLTRKNDFSQKICYVNEGKEEILNLSTLNHEGIWVYKGTGYKYPASKLRQFKKIIDVTKNNLPRETQQLHHVKYDDKGRARQFTIGLEEGNKKICLERLWDYQRFRVKHNWYVLINNELQEYHGHVPKDFTTKIHSYFPTFNEKGVLQTVTVPDGTNSIVLKLRVTIVSNNQINNKEVTVLKGTGLGFEKNDREILEKALENKLISITDTEKKLYSYTVGSKKVWIDDENKVVEIPFQKLISNFKKYQFTYNDQTKTVTINYKNKLLTLVSPYVAKKCGASANISTDNNNERPVEYSSEDESLEILSTDNNNERPVEYSSEDESLEILPTDNNNEPSVESLSEDKGNTDLEGPSKYQKIMNSQKSTQGFSLQSATESFYEDIQFMQCVIPVEEMQNEMCESQRVVPSTSSVLQDPTEWKQGFFEGLQRLEVDNRNNLSTSARHDSANRLANQVANKSFFALNNRQSNANLANQLQVQSSSSNAKPISAFFKPQSNSQHDSNIFNADRWSLDYQSPPQDPNTGGNNNELVDFDSVLNFGF
ncbi:MAG: hypothetical protein Tsb005_17910 [Gammaproteobacteria bacterium]